MRRDRTHYKTAARVLGAFILAMALIALCVLGGLAVLHHAP